MANRRPCRARKWPTARPACPPPMTTTSRCITPGFFPSVLTTVYPLPVSYIPSPGIHERNDMPLSPSTDVHEYHVDGMTCEHCRLSVTEEVSEVAGVQRVEVDLPTGHLTVVGDVDDASIAAAVADAGYRLRG